MSALISQKTGLKRDIAVYAGTFDPLTNGHKDIVERASTIFDKVIVGIAASTSKSPLFTLEERVELARKSLTELGEQVLVRPFPGLLVEFVRENKSNVIIRGLRAVSDYEY